MNMSTIIGPDDVRVDGRSTYPAFAYYIIMVSGEPAVVSWSDLALANSMETMDEIAVLGPGESTVLGQCDSIMRLFDDGTIEAEAAVVAYIMNPDAPRLKLTTGPFAGQTWDITAFPGALRAVPIIVGPKLVLRFDPRPLVTG